MSKNDLFICKLRKNNIYQEFQGSSANLQDFERIAAREGWETVFHRRI